MEGRDVAMWIVVGAVLVIALYLSSLVQDAMNLAQVAFFGSTGVQPPAWIVDNPLLGWVIANALQLVVYLFIIVGVVMIAFSIYEITERGD